MKNLLRNSLLIASILLLPKMFFPMKVSIYYYYDPLNDSYVFTNMCDDRSKCKPLLAEKGNVRHSTTYRRRAGNDKQYDALIQAAAEKYKIDFFLLKSLIKAESQFDAQAVSTMGARGLMQLMPGTAKDMGVVNSFDPEQNVMGGTRYLRLMLDKFRSVEKALAAYNAGPASVIYYQGIPPFAETQNYVVIIKNYYQKYTNKTL